MKEVRLPSLIFFYKNFLIEGLYFFLPLFFVDLGFSGLQIGLLFGIFSITSLISSFNIGLGSDRIQIRKLLFFAIAFIFLYYLGLSTLTNFIVFCILFFIGGLGDNIFQILLPSLVYKTIDKKNYGAKIGFFKGASIVGGALGIFLGGFVLLKLEFRLALKLITLLTLAMFFFLFFIKKTQTYRFKLTRYKSDLWKKEVFIFALIMFVFCFHWGAESTSYTLFLKNYFGLNTFYSGIYMAIPIFILGIMCYVFGKWLDKGASINKILSIGLLSSGIGHIIMVYPNIFVSFLARVIHELGDAAMFVFLYVGIYKLFPKQRVGGAVGVITTVTLLGRFVSSLIFGPVGEFYGYEWPFLITGIIILLIWIVYSFVQKNHSIKTIS